MANKTRDTIVKIGMIASIAIVILILYSELSSPKINYDEFAKCVTERGMVMYGATWCPHCNNQKKLFGDSFQFVKFVDCESNAELCNEAGIKGYPTWILNGRPYEGELSLKELSKMTGCALG